ncbi:fatty acid-binding protein, adipocyte-like [Alosa pseudoharengus]|uniref:fatty acid-binding protein, adipocyte-like n=1 Tax=Alosa pseudoharengus TaxID=34774 RepID=UPI003F8C4F63
MAALTATQCYRFTRVLFSKYISFNFDEYLNTLGVGFAKRQIAGKVEPSVTVSVDADGTITWNTGRKEIKFKLNEEFEETTGGDRKTRNVVELDNGTLVQKKTWDGPSRESWGATISLSR